MRKTLYTYQGVFCVMAKRLDWMGRGLMAGSARFRPARPGGRRRAGRRSNPASASSAGEHPIRGGVRS